MYRTNNAVYFSPEFGDGGGSSIIPNHPTHLNPQLEQDRQQNNNQQTQTTQTDQNNQQTNIDPLANFWDNPETTPANNQNNQQNNNQNNNNQNNQQNNNNQNNVSDEFNNYVNTLEFMDGVNLTEMAEKAREGDYTGLVDTMKQVAVNTYKNAMIDAQRSMNSEVKRAVADAVKQSTTHFALDKVVSQMNKDLSFTAKPQHAPIAKAVLAQALKKPNATPESAIQSVRSYFESIGREFNPVRPPSSRPGQGNYNNQQTQTDNQQQNNDDISWLEILEGKG